MYVAVSTLTKPKLEASLRSLTLVENTSLIQSRTHYFSSNISSKIKS